MSASQNQVGFLVFVSGLKMAVATFLSRILGLVRDQCIAYYFGASGITDAFYVAYRIPNLLRDLFAEGAFSSAFVPTFTQARLESAKASNQLLWSLFIILTVITGSICLLTYFFAPELFALFAPEFKSDAVKFELGHTMIRLMAPFLMIISWAALFMGALNSLKVFFIPALAPAVFNMVLIFSMALLPMFFHFEGQENIYTLAIGVSIGGFVQGLIQLPILFKQGFSPVKLQKIWTPYSKKVMKKLGPGMIGFAATQVNLLVTTILATGTVFGAVSWLQFAFRLFQFPIGVLSVSIAGSNLSHISDSLKQNDFKRAISILEKSYILSFLLLIPCMALLYALAPETIHIIFQRGKFTPHHTSMTSLALKMYLLGLPFYGVYKLFVPTFYALDQEKFPVMSSICSIIFNIVFCVMLVPKYSFSILALGTSISMLLNTSFLSYKLQKILKLPASFFVNFQIIKILLAGVLVFLFAKFSAPTAFHYADNLVLKILALFVIGGLGIGCYVLILLIFKEKKLFTQFLRDK